MEKDQRGILCARNSIVNENALNRDVSLVFWFSKDNPTGHSVRKKKKRQTEEEVGRQYQRVDRNGLCRLN